MASDTAKTSWTELFDGPLDVAAADRFLRDAACGGINLFVGTTRRWTGERETAELAYECYRPMALQEMAKLAQEARQRWPVERVCLFHRLGVVPVAEASVVVGVATPHRTDAFEACRYLIDTLKIHVPIWKQEHFTDGSREWVEGTPSPRGTANE